MTEYWIAARPNAYDHPPHHELNEGKPQHSAQLRARDFLLKRRGGTPVRLHPQWATTSADTFAGEGHEAEVETPAHGLGESDGRGTYNHYKQVGSQRALKFGAAKRPRPIPQ